MWENHQLTLNTKLKVYQACVLSTSDNLRLTGEPPGKLPRSLPVTNHGHQVAGQSHQHSCSGKERLAQHTPHALSAKTTVAETRAPYGGRSHPKGPLVRSVSLGMRPCRPPSSSLQGRLQAGLETEGHQPRQLRKARRLQRRLASCRT